MLVIDPQADQIFIFGSHRVFEFIKKAFLLRLGTKHRF